MNSTSLAIKERKSAFYFLSLKLAWESGDWESEPESALFYLYRKLDLMEDLSTFHFNWTSQMTLLLCVAKSDRQW